MKILNREDGHEAAPPRIQTLLEWDRERYPAGYLLQRVTEAQVQAAVIEELHRLGLWAKPYDAGAAMLRGRARGVLGRAGMAHLAPAIMAGRTGAGEKGSADVLAIVPPYGRSVWVECKAPEWRIQALPHQVSSAASPGTLQVRPPGKLKPEQREFLELQLSLGCCAGVVWHPRDLAFVLPANYRGRLL